MALPNGLLKCGKINFDNYIPAQLQCPFGSCMCLIENKIIINQSKLYHEKIVKIWLRLSQLKKS